MKLHGIAFDNDGVLVDTEPTQWQAWVHVLKPFNVTLTKKQYIDECLGYTGEHIGVFLVKKFKLPVSPHTLTGEKEKTVLEWFATKPLAIMPHAVDTLKKLHAQGIPLALVSSAPREEILIKIKRMKIESLFQTIVSRDEVEKGKPSPDMYLLAAQRLHVSPKHMMAFEDTPAGVASAHAAGMIAVAVPNDFSRSKKFPGAKYVLGDLSEVIPLIKSIE